MVACHVIRSVCVHALCTDEVEQVEELLGRGYLRLAHGALVDLRSQILTNHGVGGFCVLVVQSNDRVVDGLFCCPVKRTDALCALEQHVLQIVSQTGVLLGLID